MGNRKITIKLSEHEIDEALKELADYKQEFICKTELLREKVAELLAKEAQNGFNGSLVDEVILKGGTHEKRYADVDVSVDNSGAVSLVIASGEDAVWVEFGAGVKYNGSSGSSPNPNGAELGFTIGSFGKGNGKRETWGFYENGELVLSHGTPAKMPMTTAVTTVCNDIAKIAKEVFG